jgi:ribulose-phosphate 3-epimerase
VTFRIAPSILSADFARLGDEVRAVERAGADLIHFDVMDNHYVPNLTVGPLVCAALKPHVKLPLDVHLMVKPVDALVPEFARAGASIISFHPEASDHVDRTIALIREHGCKAGLVLNPATPVSWLDHTLEKLDLVLLMSVNPGFGGQKFITSVLPKIAEVRRRTDALKRDVWLEVDGGVKIDNIGAIARAGADTFVAGSAIFGAKDYAATIKAMRKELAGAPQAIEQAARDQAADTDRLYRGA